MNWLGGWQGIRRIRTRRGFVRDKYPRAGALMLVVMHLFSLVVGAALGVLFVFYSLMDSDIEVSHDFGRAYLKHGTIAGGLLGVGVCAWTVVASRMADRRKRDMAELARLERRGPDTILPDDPY